MSLFKIKEDQNDGFKPLENNAVINYDEKAYSFRGQHQNDGPPLAPNIKDADAVILTKNKNGRLQHHCQVRAYSDGTLYNPLEHAIKRDTILVEVSKEAFDFYLRFLQTENKLYITYAERVRNG